MKKIKKQLGEREYVDFYNIFNKTYYSHEIGIRKPNPDIFNLVLNENNLDKEKTLFIDDSIQNIKSAENIGLRTHHLLGSESIESIFPGIIL
jgi:putative hydrolase of the HAD superfamily